MTLRFSLNAQPFVNFATLLKRFFVLVALLVCASLAAASEPLDLTKAERDFFESQIRPALNEYCFECHSGKSEEIGGGLRLDRADLFRQGGESGPIVDSENADTSLLLQAIRYEGLEMPPEQPLPQAVAANFAKWIEQGAPFPESIDPEATAVAVVESDQLVLDRELHWSFFPRRDSVPPDVADQSWPRDPIDRFVLAKIESIGLQPTSDADARTLAIRLFYDLIGLPPTVAQIEQFEKELLQEGQPAVERLVDHLLAQPQFGEKWGRHWLDVARYGESNGDDGLGRNATFPQAWRYRDYVIDSLNRDVAYDRFLIEQIAGDLLPAENAIERNRQLTATGFLAIGAKPAAAMNKDFAMDIVDDQIDVVSTAALGLSVACARCHDHKHDPIPTRDYYALAGFFTSTETLYGAAANEKLTAPPTPLHELSSDWIPESKELPTTENGTPIFPMSYPEAIRSLEPRLYANLRETPEELQVEGEIEFAGAEYANFESSRLIGDVQGESDNYSVAFWFRNDTGNLDRPITAYLFTRGEIGNSDLPGDHLGIGGSHDTSRSGKLFVFNGNANKQSIAGSTVIESGSWNHVVLIRSMNRVQVFLNGSTQAEIDEELPTTIGDSNAFSLGARGDKFSPLTGRVAEFSYYDRALEAADAQQLHMASGRPATHPPVGYAMGVRDKPAASNCKIHINGSGTSLGAEVPRGFLTAYNGTGNKHSDLLLSSDQAGDTSGRLKLARWVAHPDHPQTARVMVNRVWLHLFGQGIVATPDDFGVYGSRPTHPELLDHLAQRFVDDKWSVKRLIRSIVLSRTYQLDSRSNESLSEADPENRFYARHSRRRLDAEALRDSVLFASGELDLSPGQGSDIESVDQLLNWPPGEATSLHQPSRHRSVYLCMLRNAPPPDLAAFDLPVATEIRSQRDVTTLPTHGLFLINSPFLVEQSRILARSVLEQDNLDVSARVEELFERTLHRSPSDDELQRAVQFLESIDSSLRHTAEEKQVAGAAEADAVNDPLARQLTIWASLAQGLIATNEFRYVD